MPHSGHRLWFKKYFASQWLYPTCKDDLSQSYHPHFYGPTRLPLPVPPGGAVREVKEPRHHRRQEQNGHRNCHPRSASLTPRWALTWRKGWVRWFLAANVRRGVSMCLILMYMTGQENMMFLLYQYLLALKYGFSDMGEAWIRYNQHIHQ